MLGWDVSSLDKRTAVSLAEVYKGSVLADDVPAVRKLLVHIDPLSSPTSGSSSSSSTASSNSNSNSGRSSVSVGSGGERVYKKSNPSPGPAVDKAPVQKKTDTKMNVNKSSSPPPPQQQRQQLPPQQPLIVASSSPSATLGKLGSHWQML